MDPKINISLDIINLYYTNLVATKISYFLIC